VEIEPRRVVGGLIVVAADAFEDDAESGNAQLLSDWRQNPCFFASFAIKLIKSNKKKMLKFLNKSSWSNAYDKSIRRLGIIPLIVNKIAAQ